MTICWAVRGPGPRCFDADAVWIDKMSWIGESTGPTSAGKPPKIEAKIPLAHTQSPISWSRWTRESPLQGVIEGMNGTIQVGGKCDARFAANGKILARGVC